MAVLQSFYANPSSLLYYIYYAGSVGSKNQYIHVPATAKLNIPFCKKSHDMLMKCLFILCYTMYPVNSI